MSRTGKLIVSEELYRRRLERMKQCIDLSVPPGVVAHEAKILSSSFAWSWADWWLSRLLRFPSWLHWLLSSSYREQCRWSRKEFKDQ